MLYVPSRVRFSNKCKRCGLRYPKAELECPHCKGLNDVQVADLIQRIKAERKAGANLGKLFLYITLLLVIGLLLMKL